jgi:predicted metal-dependent HD superfamily phosphohydrolase
MFFATWFHDAIQKMGVESEGKSAELAQQALSELAVPQDISERTVQLILATKTHDANVANPDVGYFIDCDLSILGAD